MQEKIFRLDSTTYVVYSLRKINTYHACPKAKYILAVQISSGQTIRINPSCYIRTMDHIITANDSEEIEIHSKWLDWTWTLGQLFQKSENEMVTSAIDKLRSKISGKFNAEILLHKVETMNKDAKENPISHWTFTTLGAMIGGPRLPIPPFLLLENVSQLRISPMTYPAPSAPPAQPTIFNMMVNVSCEFSTHPP